MQHSGEQASKDKRNELMDLWTGAWHLARPQAHAMFEWFKFPGLNITQSSEATMFVLYPLP
jgi:hypothetical protein